jgi:arylformamidase
MTAIDYEAEYNNRARIPAYRPIVESWAARSRAVRQHARGALDQAYGPGERQRYDVFHAAPGSPATRAVIAFFHGGYWQLGNRQDSAFLAPALTTAGCEVAIASYSLCPAVTVAQIIDEARAFVRAIWRATGRRVVPVGHSAGGQLAAALLATDWRSSPPSADDDGAGAPPADLVPAACAISGVFELAPLIATTMNHALRLDATSAAAVSPLLGPPPGAGRTLVTAVGADETGEFHRQSHAIVERWAAAGVATEYHALAGRHHFDVLEELTTPDSALFARIVSLASPQ